MNYKKLIGTLLVGAAIYGAYKYGEKKGRETNDILYIITLITGFIESAPIPVSMPL